MTTHTVRIRLVGDAPAVAAAQQAIARAMRITHASAPQPRRHSTDVAVYLECQAQTDGGQQR